MIHHRRVGEKGGGARRREKKARAPAERTTPDHHHQNSPVTCRSTLVVKKRLLHTDGKRNTCSKACCALKPPGNSNALRGLLSVSKEKVLLGIDPNTFSKSRSTAGRAEEGAALSTRRMRPEPSMEPMTCFVFVGGGDGRRGSGVRRGGGEKRRRRPQKKGAEAAKTKTKNKSAQHILETLNSIWREKASQ